MEEFFAREPRIFSLGGGAPDLSEDTKDNFRKAMDLGSDVIRTNIIRTSDNKLVLFSEAMLQHEPFRKLRLSKYSLQELRDTFGESATPKVRDTLFPEIAGVIEEFPQSLFNFEIFEPDPVCVKEYCAAVSALNYRGRILTSSMYGKIISAVRKIDPHMLTSFSISGAVGVYALFRSGLLYFIKKFKSCALIVPESIGISYFANQALVREAQERGLKVYIRDVADSEMVVRLHQCGVDGYITSDLLMLKKKLQDLDG